MDDNTKRRDGACSRRRGRRTLIYTVCVCCASVHFSVVVYASILVITTSQAPVPFCIFGCLGVSIVYAHIVRRVLFQSEKKAIDAVLRSSTSLITEGPLKILHKCLIRFGNL